MIAFICIAALMSATALAFILPTLLRNEPVGVTHARRDALNLEVLRDQLRELDADRVAGIIDDAGYDSSRRELERRVAEEVKPEMQPAVTNGKPRTAMAIALLLPLCAAALYWSQGNHVALDPAQLVAKQPEQTVTPEQIAGMVDKLAHKLKETPDDAEGWSMLARSYNALGRFGDAVDAYSHLLKLIPPNADILVDYADSLAMASNRSLLGEPEKIIARALAIDSRNIKGLALSGAAAFERHDYSTAIAQWKQIQVLTPPDSDIARSVESSISQAESLAGTAAPSTGSGEKNALAKAAAQVSGMVELDVALRAQAADTDTVFIFARAVNGPRFPLAVLRRQVRDLPLKFTLDDSMSMMPNAKLSSFPLVVVGARISKSGSATPASGDLEGISEPVHPGANDLKIRIDTQRK